MLPDAKGAVASTLSARLAYPKMLVEDVLLIVMSMQDLSPRDLANAARVHRTWADPARLSLYEFVDVTIPSDSFASTMWNCPYLRRLVRQVSLTVYWPFATRRSVLSHYCGSHCAQMVRCFGWMDLPETRVYSLSVYTGDEWATALAVAFHLNGAPIMDRLRRLRLNGLHLQVEIPPQLEDLHLVGSASLRYYFDIPSNLLRLRIIDLTRIPLDFVRAVSSTLVSLHLDFSTLFRGKRVVADLNWSWPVFSALEDMILIADKGENLRLAKLGRGPKSLGLSLCLFRSNQLPQSVEALDIFGSGVLTYVDVQRFILHRHVSGLKVQHISLECCVEQGARDALSSAGISVELSKPDLGVDNKVIM